jgi:hypothetical protein
LIVIFDALVTGALFRLSVRLRRLGRLVELFEVLFTPLYFREVLLSLLLL